MKLPPKHFVEQSIMHDTKKVGVQSHELCIITVHKAKYTRRNVARSDGEL